ncbi:hypothetical protein ACFOUO_11285 [Salinithrix halophila]|uniref:Carboxypeptidase regulatory-like domain-containing protein n=2 Tax=Salinithrix halophila TaxID=1485204 RepID=A0ABV8JEL5_9BACL
MPLMFVFSVLIAGGCSKEEPKPNLTPITIQIVNKEGEPIPRFAVGITVIIEEEEKDEVGAIPKAMLTNREGKVVVGLSTSQKYKIEAGPQKKVITISKKPMTVKFIVDSKALPE